jgi:uncharacterized Ntn-hydrolase superfamily protein
MEPSFPIANASSSAVDSSAGWDNTFSIVARDSQTGALGAAVATARLAVGNRVPFVEFNVGAVATQANTNVVLAHDALHLLKEGLDAPTVLNKVLAADPQREERQLTIIDNKGNQAAFTGSKPQDYKGHLFGTDCVVAGNILVGEETLIAMVRAFENSEGSLGDRMMTAMEAGQKAGGDKRGKVSAALIVMSADLEPNAYSKNINLRVDRSADPVAELRTLYDAYKAAFEIG